MHFINFYNAEIKLILFIKKKIKNVLHHSKKIALFENAKLKSYHVNKLFYLEIYKKN